MKIMIPHVEARSLTAYKTYTPTMIRAIQTVFRLLRVRDKSEISLVIVGEKRMRELNKRWRNKDSVTDVLSFGLWKLDLPLETKISAVTHVGEIVICIAYAKKQARILSVSLSQILTLLAAHGAIHLAGIDHERSKKEERLTEHIQKSVLQKI